MDVASYKDADSKAATWLLFIMPSCCCCCCRGLFTVMLQLEPGLLVGSAFGFWLLRCETDDSQPNASTSTSTAYASSPALTHIDCWSLSVSCPLPCFTGRDLSLAAASSLAILVKVVSPRFTQ